MSKKNLLFLLIALSLIAGIVITFTVDVDTNQYEDKLIAFHENSSCVYIDTYFTDTFIPQITDEKYAEELKSKVSQITEIIEKEIDPYLIMTELREKSIDEIEEKAMKAKKGIEKMLKIIDEIETSMPSEFKSLYNPEEAQKIRDLVALIPAGGVGSKKLFRVFLILLLGVVGGVIFINIERKARLSGEIKAKDIV